MKVNIAKQSVDIIQYLLLDIAQHLDLYKKGELHYDWSKGVIVNRKSIDYEEMLTSFLQVNNRENLKLGDKILIVIGGIGTGKSSAIEYVIHKVAQKKIICKKDGESIEVNPTILKFNFNDIDDELSQMEVAEFFWSTISSTIEKNTPSVLTPEEEITKFWLWCLEQNSLMQKSSYLQKEINALKHHITYALEYKPYWDYSPEKLVEILIESRVKIFENMSPSDLAYYKLFLLKYISLFKHPSNCVYFYILVDNVDQFDSNLQKVITKFSIFMSDVLNSKTIVTIRPLTWARSPHSHVLVNTQIHYSPDIIKVIESRFEKYIEENEISYELESAMRALTNIIIGKSKHRFLPKLLRATSGISLRFALRNYGNLLISPILTDVDHNYDSDIPFQNLRVSDIVKAFFFSDEDSIIARSYTNLYSIGQDNHIKYSLVKSRILDYLIRIEKGCTKVINLFSFVKMFNSDEEMIEEALLELMLRSRPLMWCEDGFKKINHDSHANIVITPIGHGYYNDLFGEFYYDEVCLANSLTHMVSLEDVYEHHLVITKQDFDEIRYFKNEYGASAYKQYYDSGITSLSLLHWEKFRIGLRNRASKENKKINFEREETIKNTVSKILLNTV